MSSTRLPGKVLLTALGEPLLAHLVRRLRAVPSIDEIVLATTVNSADDILAAFARDAGITCFRGSEEDVLGRVLAAASAAGAEVVAATTADNPIVDPDIIETVIRTYLANDADYVSNTHVKSFPDGMDVQVFALAALRRSAAVAAAALEREHVTLHIRQHPALFRAIHVVAPPALHWPELSLTLDVPEDYELLRRVIEALGPADPLFGCGEVITLLRAHGDWVGLNRHVTRKGDS